MFVRLQNDPAIGQIDIAPLQADDLAPAHSCHGEQLDSGRRWRCYGTLGFQPCERREHPRIVFDTFEDRVTLSVAERFFGLSGQESNPKLARDVGAKAAA
jgi:hypothetical protein